MPRTLGTWNRKVDIGMLPARRDLLLLGYLPPMALAAWLVPEAAWMRLCMAVTRLSGGIAKQRADNARTIARLLPDRFSADEARRIAAACSAYNHDARLHVLRCLRSPSWRPRLTLVGREHVETALGAGAGAVFWNAPFVYNNLITKMAMHEAGYSVAHLTGPQHGLSTSRFAVRFLNPIWNRVETRFLAERVMMTTDESPGALRRLLRRLQDNQLVSITMGSNGRRRHTTRFFDGQLTLANGAPRLARRAGAALLPVFTVRHDNGTFVTTIGAPAHLADGLDAEEAERQLVAHCVGLLEAEVARWPEQFSGWNTVDAQDVAPG
jgi:lauroyl/myristoyl acyltransferase